MQRDPATDTPGSSDAIVEPKSPKFVWPLAPLPDDEPTRSPEREDAGGGFVPRRNWMALIRDAETYWLSPRSLPLARRMESRSWVCDRLSEYCNRCAQTVGFGEDDEFGCAKCRDRRIAWSRAVRLGEFEGDLASWVKEVKFARNASLGVDLGRMLATRLHEAGVPRERVCIVPIPMSARERWLKGFDHARRIAEGVGGGLWAPVVTALVREHRPSQRSMASVTARERNVRRAFRQARGVDLFGWTVVLVDDVMTTGATMRAAAKALLPRRHVLRPAAIWAATVGVTPDRRQMGVDSRELSSGGVV